MRKASQVGTLQCAKTPSIIEKVCGLSSPSTCLTIHQVFGKVWQSISAYSLQQCQSRSARTCMVFCLMRTRSTLISSKRRCQLMQKETRRKRSCTNVRHVPSVWKILRRFRGKAALGTALVTDCRMKALSQAFWTRLARFLN